MDGARMTDMDMGMMHTDNSSSSITTMGTIRTNDTKTKKICGDPIRPEPIGLEGEALITLGMALGRQRNGQGSRQEDAYAHLPLTGYRALA